MPSVQPSSEIDEAKNVTVGLYEQQIIAADARVEDWADQIRPHLAKAVQSIVAVGEAFIRAKKDLVIRGDFGRLCTKLGVTTRTAQRFMAIARHPVLSDATHASHLPPSWSTLAELTVLNPSEVKTAIASGTITPKIDRGRAREIIASFVTTRRRRGEEVEEVHEHDVEEVAPAPDAPKLGPMKQRWKREFGLHLRTFDGFTIEKVNPDFISTMTPAERADWLDGCRQSEAGLRRFRRELEQLGGDR